MDHNQATSLELDELTKALDTNIWTGLSEAEADSRLERHGKNLLVRDELEEINSGGRLLRELREFARQFLSPLIQLPALAAIVYAATFNFLNSISILVAITVVGIISRLHWRRIDRRLLEVARRMPATCRVQRDGHAREIQAELLVPGDVVHLRDGQRAPADLRPIETFASLNDSTTSATNKSLVLIGNLVEASSSQLRGLVVMTGRSTRYGKTLTELRNLPPAQIEQLSLHLIVWSSLLIGCIAILGIVQLRDSVEVFEFALALFVTALPEGLPAVVAASLVDVCQQLVDSDPDDLPIRLDRISDEMRASLPVKITTYMTYQISLSLVSMALIVVAFASGGEPPLGAMQILTLINLLADGLPVQALAMEHPQEHPNPYEPDPSASWCRLLGITLALFATILTLNGCLYEFLLDDEAQLDGHSRGLLLTCVVFCAIFAALGLRSHTKTTFETRPHANLHLLCCCLVLALAQVALTQVEPLARLLDCQPLKLKELAQVVLYAALVLLVMDGLKLLARFVQLARKLLLKAALSLHTSSASMDISTELVAGFRRASAPPPPQHQQQRRGPRSPQVVMHTFASILTSQNSIESLQSEGLKEKLKGNF